MMIKEEELKLETQRIAVFLNDIDRLKADFLDINKDTTEINQFFVANMLGKCYENIKRLHVINMETIRENEALADHRRWVLAGQAMAALITSDGVCHDTEVEAFKLADSMVKHGKKNSETKCTNDGTGNTSAEDSNRK